MNIRKILILILALAITLTPLTVLTACSGDNGGETASDTQTEAETDAPVDPVDPASLGEPFDSYENGVGSLLRSWQNANADTFRGVCAYYESQGWTFYRSADMNGNLSSTYQKDGEVTHVYLNPTRSELNISTDPAGVSTLPPAQPEVTTGTEKTSVTQVSAGEINGMGYIIRLADGSFIVYDGGYDAGVKEFKDAIETLNGGPDNIHIRMWILTHSHDDHYPCAVSYMRSKQSENVQLDYLMYCPITKSEAGASSGSDFFTGGLLKRLDNFRSHGAEIVIAHTGMTFRFCNVTLEVLSSADEMWIEENYGNFNNTSTVTRITTDEGHSMILLADAARAVGDKMIEFYGDYLKSDICQIAHHGVEDYPLEAYNLIAASILFYPCSQSLYDLPDRDADVRAALREAPFVKEILIRDSNRFTRMIDGE